MKIQTLLETHHIDQWIASSLKFHTFLSIKRSARLMSQSWRPLKPTTHRSHFDHRLILGQRAPPGPLPPWAMIGSQGDGRRWAKLALLSLLSHILRELRRSLFHFRQVLIEFFQMFLMQLAIWRQKLVSRIVLGNFRRLPWGSGIYQLFGLQVLLHLFNVEVVAALCPLLTRGGCASHRFSQGKRVEDNRKLRCLRRKNICNLSKSWGTWPEWLDSTWTWFYAYLTYMFKCQVK